MKMKAKYNVNVIAKHLKSAKQGGGTYSNEQDEMIQLASELIVLRRKMFDEIMSADSLTVTKITTMGEQQMMVSPLVAQYVSIAKQGQAALKALGMNMDSRVLKDGGGDPLSDFMKAINEYEDDC